MRKDSYKDLFVANHCYGCGLCATVCKSNVLTMKLNADGFYVPQVSSPEKCVGCGLCVKVCSFHSDSAQPDSKNPIGCFAGWSNELHARYHCSSGGVAMEIARYGIEHGYKVCTVKYDNIKKRAEHYIAESKETLEESVGSKYLQSYTFAGFSKINLNEKHVVIGTPCQIDMWRRYLRLRKKEENFILVDFFCHGVPTMNLWRKYLKEKVDILPNSTITWRDKIDGWHSSWNICAYQFRQVKSVKPYYRSSAIKNKDLFYSMFLGNYCLNRSCYANCKYKLCNSSADIRLGDFWGATYSAVDDGVNSVLTFTSKGQQIIKDINITSIDHTIAEVCEGQMQKPVRKPWFYAICVWALQSPFIKLSKIRFAIVLEEILSFQIKKIKERIIG